MLRISILPTEMLRNIFVCDHDLALNNFLFRNILCYALYRDLPEGGFEDNNSGSSASRGNQGRHWIFISTLIIFQVLTKDSVTVSVDAVVSFLMAKVRIQE